MEILFTKTEKFKVEAIMLRALKMVHGSIFMTMEKLREVVPGLEGKKLGFGIHIIAMEICELARSMKMVCQLDLTI